MRDLWGWKPARGKASRLAAAALALGLAGSALPAPANAQFFGGWDGWGGSSGGWGGVGPGEVYQAIAERGFRVIAPLRRNGSVFVDDVLDRRGRRERLVVAAADAQILRRFYLDDPRLPGFVPRGQAGAGDTEGERADRGDEPVPPGVIPGIGRGDDDAVPAMRPPRAKPVRPARPRTVERTPADARPSLDPAPPVAVAPPPSKPAETARVPSGEPEAPGLRGTADPGHPESRSRSLKGLGPD